MHRFTTEFGMGSGGTNALWSSNKLVRAYHLGLLCHQGNTARMIEKVLLAIPKSQKTLALYGQATRAISIGQLNASQRLHIRPIKQLVLLSPLGDLSLGENSS